MPQEQSSPVTADPTTLPEIANVPIRPDFYIKNMKVCGFRSLTEVVFNFQPTLNVIIGANNSGKTAVIDALRIMFNLGSFQEKEDFIRLKASDICRSGGCTETANVTFEVTFCGKDNEEIAAQFYDMDSNEEGDPGYRLFKLRYQVQFKRSNASSEYRYSASQITGGEQFQNTVSQESLDYIKSIYLAPLRDIVNDGNRLGREIERLLMGHGSAEDLRAIPGEVRAKAEELIAAATNNAHEQTAGKALAKYASMYGFPNDSLKFIPSGLNEDMLRSLQIVFNHGHHGPDGLGLGSNGLGINNLIYASIVLSRNEVASQLLHHRFLLIEEPEAHLHPQSQESFFQELNEVSSHQIFVTSHSPTITAKCDLEKVIVMGHPCEAKKNEPCHLAEILDGHEADKRYLHKFLDVTRSQLLFANGAIFVEGVTEAMLLQVFSEMLGCSLRAAGVEIVALGSNGGFDHFRRLVGSDGLSMRCAFLTDGDEAPSELPQERDSLIKLAESAKKEVDGNVRVYRNVGTFEFELLLAASDLPDANMRQLLISAMSEARHATAETNKLFGEDFMDFQNPILSYRKMKQKKAGDNLVEDSQWYGGAHTNSEFTGAKSEFSYLLLQQMVDGEKTAFKVPNYIAEAIKYVAGQEEPLPEQSTVPISSSTATP
jgi:putative ATP-dependent endonuclease of OLD family